MLFILQCIVSESFFFLDPVRRWIRLIPISISCLGSLPSTESFLARPAIGILLRHHLPSTQLPSFLPIPPKRTIHPQISFPPSLPPPLPPQRKKNQGAFRPGSLGKSVACLTFPSPNHNIVMRLRPNPPPPWGAHPHRKAST